MADRHKPGDVPVTFRCPKDLRERLDAETEGSSRSAFIVEAIAEKLERDAVHAASSSGSDSGIPVAIDRT